MLTDREIFMALVDNDSIQESDAIILLEGDGLNRYKHAVQLFQEGWAPLIVFSGGIVDYEYGSIPYEEIYPRMLASGISPESIIHERKSLNTKEQADNVIKMCEARGWKSIILVGSPYHQYRAFLTFLKSAINMLPELIIFNSPAKNLPWFYKEDWGNRFKNLQGEFDRIERYMALGHLASFREVIEYMEWKESLVNY